MRVTLIEAIARHAERARPEVPRTAGELECARGWLLNALARALTAGRRPELAHLLKPLVPGAVMPGGTRVPGTSLELDPVQGAFVNALLTGWECGTVTAAGHPCQHAGALLATADARARRALMRGEPPMSVRELEGALLTSCEIQQGLAALAPPLHGQRDDTLLLLVAQTAVLTVLMGGTFQHTLQALSHAFIDGAALPAPRQSPDRRAAEAVSRAVRLALRTLAGEPAHILECGSSEAPGTAPVFDAHPLPETPGGPQEALLQLLTAAGQAYRPPQLQRIQTFLGSAEQLESRTVSELMAHLATHAVREGSRQLALLP